ncbi:hypothetical protein [Nocardia sp. CDC153]|uniref:hypothetical protein n=1 Tax=Nocardia sp. CDC153 TaxID=3112167 RepID=UPI003FA36873
MEHLPSEQVAVRDAKGESSPVLSFDGTAWGLLCERGERRQLRSSLGIGPRC